MWFLLAWGLVTVAVWIAFLIDILHDDLYPASADTPRKHGQHVVIKLKLRSFKAVANRLDPTWLNASMLQASQHLLKHAQAGLGYVGKDCILLCYRDVGFNPETLFGGNLQKATSTLAAEASVLLYQSLMHCFFQSDSVSDSLFNQADHVRKCHPHFSAKVYQFETNSELYSFLTQQDRCLSGQVLKHIVTTEQSTEDEKTQSTCVVRKWIPMRLSENSERLSRLFRETGSFKRLVLPE